MGKNKKRKRTKIETEETKGHLYADIFLGMWDDNRYVNQVRETFKTRTKLTEDKLASMISAISSGKGDVVKSRMGDYEITKEQSISLKEAFDAVK